MMHLAVANVACRADVQHSPRSLTERRSEDGRAAKIREKAVGRAFASVGDYASPVSWNEAA